MNRLVACSALLLGALRCAPASPGGDGAAVPVTTVDMAPLAASPAPSSSASSSASASAGPPPGPYPAAGSRLSAKLPAKISLPAEVACELRAEQPSVVIELRLRAGGNAVARLLNPPRATLTLPVGAMTGGAVIDATDGPNSVRAAVNGTDVLLYPSRAMVMSGYAIPNASAQLSWAAGHRDGGGRLDVTLPEVTEEHVELRRPIEHRIDCAGVGLKRAKYDVDAAVPGVSSTTPGELLATRIELRDKPAGEVVAVLDLTKADQRDALIYQRRAGQARIGFHAGDALLFGWIAGSLVKKTAPALPGLYGFGTGRGGWGGGHWVLRRCDHELPLIGRDGEELALLGVIGAGTQFKHRLPAAEPYVAVRLVALRWLSSSSAHSLAVPTALLEGCGNPTDKPR